MKASHIAEFACIRLLQVFLLLMPLRLVRVVAKGAGLVVYAAGYRRGVSLSNLRYALPNLREAERRRIARQSYMSVAVTLFEFMVLPRFLAEDVDRLVTIANSDVLRASLRKKNGVLLLTAHYGSWELFGQAAGRAAGRDGCLLMKVQSNPYVAQAVDRWRTHAGLRTSSSGASGLREVVRTLRQGGWVVIAADQAAPMESVRVSFFGREVPTYQGPAAFALQTGAEIVFGVAHRTGDGRYVITFENISTDGLPSEPDEALTELTRRHVEVTERFILRDPGQWMWMHRRWKHLEQETV